MGPLDSMNWTHTGHSLKGIVVDFDLKQMKPYIFGDDEAWHHNYIGPGATAGDKSEGKDEISEIEQLRIDNSRLMDENDSYRAALQIADEENGRLGHELVQALLELANKES